MLKKKLILSFFLLFQVSAWLISAIPAEERAALIAFYNSTNGNNWSNKSGWKDEPLEADGFASIGSEGNWYGITVSGNHVTEISLHWQTYFNGTIPPEVGNLAYLERIELEGPVLWPTNGAIHGNLPPELGKLKNLKYLNLQRNGITGNIPGSFGNMNKLEELYLYCNFLSGDLPKELGNLENLRIFRIGNNPLSCPIPPELGNMRNLEELEMTFNRLSGSIPKELGKLKNLKVFESRLNLLSGSLPPELGNLKNLKVLSLSNNSLTGIIPPEFGNLENLKVIDFSENQLSGSIPLEFGNLGNLESIHLVNNQLSGIIPPGMGNLWNLQVINFSQNQLSGSIPHEFGNLGKLEYLDLSSNQLTGIIPPELGNLGNLMELFLNLNHLSGGLPKQLGQLSKLQKLDLSNNRLVGEIPLTFLNLARLTGLWIYDNGLYTHNKSLIEFLNRLNDGWELTQTVAPEGLSALGIDTSAITITWKPILYSQNIGGYLVYCSTISGGPWAYAGMTPGTESASYTVSGLRPGTTYFFIVKTQSGMDTISFNTVTSESSKEVYATTLDASPGEDQPPFGRLELPQEDGEIKSGNTPVCGWALDDVEVVSVQIYCLVGNSKFYIDDALFVEGARPDIEQAYPGYPNNRRAGWGYLLLTNVLPNDGSGTYALQAVAADSLGHETILGTKTIYCDNLGINAKPFGAIDTPTSGGTASGSDFINFGWVLPSLFNSIPTDGSTINVWVDGVPLGHPVYNQYRQDIAALFPQYNNSDGAGGYFYLDTTRYENGMHTISWSVTDDAGKTDGIGSRYFFIQNPGSSQQANSSTISQQTVDYSREKVTLDISKILVDYPGPVRVKNGFDDSESQDFYPGEGGIIDIEINQSERTEIHLYRELDLGSNTAEVSSCRRRGFQLAGNRQRPLPIGSNFDAEKGIFYWQPGPAFLGSYLLMFIEGEQYGNMTGKYVRVNIRPSR